MLPVCVQGGQLGERSIPLSFPEGWLLDDAGGSITRADVAPMDIAAVALGVAAASADLALHHSSFTLNNLLACLIATDILQVLLCCTFLVRASQACGGFCLC